MTRNEKRAYFDFLSTSRVKARRDKSFYWDDITHYCDYFITEDTSVLEIGCGTGELLQGIKAKKKTGIDFSEGMVSAARKQFPLLDIRLMDAEDLELDSTYDLVILSNLIGYLDDVQEVFTQLHKVCHKRTKILVTSYNFLWEPVLRFGEWIGYKTKTPQQNWLSLADINNLLHLSGFEVYRNTRRTLLPVYIPFISFFLNKVIAKIPLIDHLCINNFTFAWRLSEGEEEAHHVSVVIPARNESGNIEGAVKRMPMLGKGVEIIFSESNSTDDTWQEILRVKEKYAGSHDIRAIQTTTKGKRDAVRSGFNQAKGDILMILDADLTVPPEDLTKFYHVIASGKADFVNGSRLVYPMDKHAMRFLNLLGNKFFSVFFTWLMDQRFKDTLCGTKVLFKNDYELLERNRAYFGDMDPFGDYDLLFGAYKLNLCIKELPVHYRKRVYGKTNILRFRHGWILLKMCLFAMRKIKMR